MSPNHSRSPATSTGRGGASDEAILHRLGYAQVLYREMGGFSNFAISFTIISILSGCLNSYYIAFNNGGPVAITWGWLLVGVFCVLVALAMGEIASAMPTAGALYFWASKLGGPAWGWFTGWFNLIGQIAVTAAIDYGAAIFTTALLAPVVPRAGRHRPQDGLRRLHRDHRAAHGAEPAQRQPARQAQHVLGLVAHGRRRVDRRGAGDRARASTSRPRSCSARRSTTPGSPETAGAAGFWFVFGIGLLMAQYTITGFDASAHMSEETRQASRAAALGMVMSVVVSVVFGFVLLVAITFAVPDVQGTLDAGGVRGALHLADLAGRRPGRMFLLIIAAVAQFFCGTASVTSASRMMFAFSRDGAVPGSRLWRTGGQQPGAGQLRSSRSACWPGR